MTTVVHFSTAHSSGDTRIFHKELQTLASAGYDCHYVVFDDGERIQKDGITIHPLGDRSRRDRWLDMNHLYRSVAALDANIYHFHDFELIPVGVALKMRTDGRVIYDAHENYPRRVTDREWIPTLARPILRATVPRLESVAGQYFDGVIGATEWVSASLEERGISDVVTIRNFPRLSTITVDSSDTITVESGPTLVYVGSISPQRGIYDMLELLAELRTRGWDASFVCLGQFTSPEIERNVREFISERGLDAATEFPGYVEHTEMFQYLSDGDIGLALLDVDYSEGLIPTKLFEYMYSKLPVVITEIPAADRYVSQKWGRVVPEAETEIQADVVELLLDSPQTRAEMGVAGRHAVETEFSWKTEAETLLALYDTLVSQS